MNIVFPIVGFQMVGTNLFQCLGMVSKSVFLSLSRQLLCLVPFIYLLPLAFDAGKEVIKIYSHNGYQVAQASDYDNERAAQKLVQELTAAN